ILACFTTRARWLPAIPIRPWSSYAAPPRSVMWKPRKPWSSSTPAGEVGSVAIHLTSLNQLFDGRKLVLEAKGLGAEYRQRRGRAHLRRGADADHLQPLAISERFGGDGLGGFAVHHADKVGHDGQHPAVAAGHQM